MKINAPIKSSLPVKSYALGMALSLAAFTASAAPLPYADVGTENVVQYTFTATTTGDIVAYFAGKGGAVYTNSLSISVNGVETDSFGLNNQTSTYGDSFILGSANAGDTIVFSLRVLDTGSTWYSSKGLNTDGSNHVYSSAFLADEELVPSGVYVGFEDLTTNGGPGSDFNYSDEQFVVTNVTTSTVPVPATVWLFSSGLLGFAGITRRRVKNA
jgi:hypothetical protein